MRKVIKSIGILLLMALVLVGCSSSDENDARKVASKFGKELYTVDSKKIDDYNAMTNLNDVKSISEAMRSNDRSLRALMTDNAYDILISSRSNTINIQGCAASNYTMKVTDLILSKNVYDIKENKAGYYFEAKLKIIADKDKSEQSDEGKGYIGLSKENGQWKVSVYKMTVLPKTVKEALDNRFK